MDARQGRSDDSIGHAVNYLGKLNCTVPTVVKLQAELGRSYARIRKTVTTQMVAHHSLGAHGKRLAKLKLDLRRHHLLKISVQGKRLLRGLPGIEESLRVPPTRALAKSHVDAAHRIAEAVRPHAKAFRAAGFPAQFITALERAAAALAAADDRPDDSSATRSIATRALKAEISNARQIIASIDVELKSHYDSTSLVLVGWNHAKRIGNRRGRPRKKKPPES